jgi:hypothetical protein
MLAAAQIGIVGTGILGCVPRMRRIAIIGVAHYLCLVQTAAVVGFLKGLLGRQAVAWRRFARAKVQPT